MSAKSSPEREGSNSPPTNSNPTHSPTTTTSPSNTQIAKPNPDRKARFEALKARNTASRLSNRKETAAEAQRLSTDPQALIAVQRKHAIASHKLLKADAEAAGEDFERKRAWDWTADESAKWDERMEEKARNRDDVAFQDYVQEARKVYERQIKGLEKPDLEKYRAEKEIAMRKAGKGGEVMVVEDEDGEVVPVDRSGRSFGNAGELPPGEMVVGHKPDKEAIDKMVSDLQKAEEMRMKKRKRRNGEGDDGDVTYINEKNKQFNMRLARSYNKYTQEIRENFERGTAI